MLETVIESWLCYRYMLCFHYIILIQFFYTRETHVNKTLIIIFYYWRIKIYLFKIACGVLIWNIRNNSSYQFLTPHTIIYNIKSYYDWIVCNCCSEERNESWVSKIIIIFFLSRGWISILFNCTEWNKPWKVVAVLRVTVLPG